MIKRSLACLALLAFTVSVQGWTPQKSKAVNPKTVIKDENAKQMLLGQHRLSLQWISWDYFGKINVTDSKGTLLINGEQKGRGTADYLTVDGIITMVMPKNSRSKER